MVAEEFNSLANRHFQNLVDVFAFPCHLKALSCVTLAVANITGDPNIWKEVHFQFNRTCPFTRFAASTFDVKTERSRGVTALFSEGRF